MYQSNLFATTLIVNAATSIKRVLHIVIGGLHRFLSSMKWLKRKLRSRLTEHNLGHFDLEQTSSTYRLSIPASAKLYPSLDALLCIFAVHESRQVSRHEAVSGAHGVLDDVNPRHLDIGPQ